MSEVDPGPDRNNVNVTLDPLRAALEDLRGKEFPCPLCAAGLPILPSKRRKPYCTCNACGIQIFFRGKVGIARLRRMAQGGILIPAKEESASHGISLLNRLEQLKLQKQELEARRGFISRDSSLENAIEIVDAEIESVQGELAKIARTKRRELHT
jgi:hypothetical protein